MTTEVIINGYFDFTVCILDTEIQTDNETAQRVLDYIEQGEFVINIRDRYIYNVNGLDNPLYSFILEATDSAEYNFEN
jgi:hypothetical protein